MINKVSDILKIKDKAEKERMFYDLMNNIDYPCDLQVVESEGRIQGPGSKKLLVKIAKHAWIGEEYLKNTEGKPILSKDTFHIHYEPTLDTFKNTLTFPFHYEVNDYLPLKNKDKENDLVGYKGYNDRRELIKEYVLAKLRLINNAHIDPSATKLNLLCKLEFDNLDISTLEFTEKVSYLVGIVEEIIDDALENA